MSSEDLEKRTELRPARWTRRRRLSRALPQVVEELDQLCDAVPVSAGRGDSERDAEMADATWCWIVGRRRSIVTDTLGLLPATLVTAAGVPDSVAGTHLVGQVAAAHLQVHTVRGDGGHRRHLVEHAATRGTDRHIVRRAPAARGSQSCPAAGPPSAPWNGW